MKIRMVLLGMLAAGSIATNAIAADTASSKSATEGTGASSSEMHSKSGSMTGHEGGMMGEHSMTGTITSINHKTGMLGLKTHEGKLELHFPPSAIKSLKDHEKITVHLGFTKGASKGGGM